MWQLTRLLNRNVVTLNQKRFIQLGSTFDVRESHRHLWCMGLQGFEIPVRDSVESDLP